MVVRTVLQIKLDATIKLHMCFSEKGIRAFAELVLESDFVGDVCLGAAFSRALSSDFSVV